MRNIETSFSIFYFDNIRRLFIIPFGLNFGPGCFILSNTGFIMFVEKVSIGNDMSYIIKMAVGND